jgi:hypothetical protein
MKTIGGWDWNNRFQLLVDELNSIPEHETEARMRTYAELANLSQVHFFLSFVFFQHKN